ncbi:response regulator [Mucilaginibacter hurinus]|uniref:Response regulator n=2 Tax=Mucilaginibacter hurinus TaxID=2201324 RepID=A0A367GQM0_9SPHI|nr:response regulator [Mucilaginibacter hurinus]
MINIACVIDDDEIYTFAVKRIIAHAKFAEKTLFFHNGQVALDFFAEYIRQTDMLPDVILLDINMPVLDGWQFMDEFAKLVPHIDKKIIVYIVSSSIAEEDYSKAKSIESVSDFIVKPITVEKLHLILEQINAD